MTLLSPRPRTLTDVVIPRLESSRIVRLVSDAVDRATATITIDEDSLLRSGLIGHSVHPMLTDVPLGSWMSTSVLDLFGGRKSQRAAELLLTLGVAAALPTAVTGAADMLALTGGARRIAQVHALGADVALGLFVGSLVARRKGRQRLGVVLALAGNGVAAGAGFLGSDLALRRGTAA